MKLKTFRADNMSQAMQIIKDEIGPDAVIMSSKQVRKRKGLWGLFGKKEYEVRVGFEEQEDAKPLQPETATNEIYNRYPVKAEAAPPNVPRDNHEIKQDMEELKGMIERLSERVSSPESQTQKYFSSEITRICQRMIKNGVEEMVAEKICSDAEKIVDSRDADAEEVVFSLVKNSLGKPCPIETTKYRQKAVMLIGPPGVGKTTTLIKLAYMLVYQENLNIGIVNADSFRIAAKEHIEAYCEILKTDMVTIYKPEELKDAMAAFADKDVILIDTSGKISDDNQYLMDIAKLVNIGKIDDICITLSAATSERVLRSTLKNYSFLKKCSIIITKTDEAPERGVFLSLAEISGRPLRYMTTGQNVPDDIKLVDPTEIAGSILEK